jgi:hypothetical protein
MYICILSISKNCIILQKYGLHVYKTLSIKYYYEKCIYNDSYLYKICKKMTKKIDKTY